ncbi:uncharacterized protein LOC110986999 [Acanthaster planci]|uniref:Uncharacterized protein LOC110986999 n=1 Tax=Acanthaster planci TaxID=133434 RepID=A0A8B7ZJK7_ACAPL|nr:uncharacterized protein LOC110986999 [Acanthaster planci]
MGSRWTLLLYLFSMLLILTGLTEAEEATVATYADDQKGTCHYELKIPAVSCQQCKCESDTSTTDAVRELEKRLNAMERQIQQITTMVPPDYEISDYSTTPFSSIIENDHPYASPVFNGEGVSIQELLSSSPEYDEPSPPVPTGSDYS